MNANDPVSDDHDAKYDSTPREEDTPLSPDLAETFIQHSGDVANRIEPADEGYASGRFRKKAGIDELSGLFGRYRIERKLGAGGMGAVFVAHDTQLDRRVALKVPFFSDGDGPDVVERFYREARAMAALQHANLCAVFDVGETDGVQYLTMALIDGHPLSNELGKGKPYPVQQAALIVRKLALALQSAHSSGIVHRDLKPGNVMIRRDGEPVLLDFGLARRQHEGGTRLTQSGGMLGTPAYMAPEQVKGRQDQVGPAADIYSLGVILYQMLTGQLPFSGSLGSIMAKILTEDPPPPRQTCENIDLDLEAICLKAMARRIEDRYGTAGEMAGDLQQFLDGSGSAAGIAVKSRKRSDRRRSRRRVWIGATAVLAALGLSVAIVVFFIRPAVNDGLPDIPEGQEDIATESDSTRSAAGESWRLPPEPRRYPSFPDAISAPPPWLLADEGVPFDIKSQFEMPVREENAAPLYLDAFYEFNTEFEICFTELERARRTQTIADRMKRFNDLHIRWGADHNAVTPTEMDIMWQEFEPAFQKLHSAQRRQKCVFETGISGTSHMPMAQVARSIARVTQMRVSRDVERGDFDAAIKDLAVLSRMSRDLNHGGSLVTSLVSVAMDFILCASIRDLVLDSALTTPHCDELFALLNEHLLIRDESILQALKQEYILFRVTLHDIEHRTGDFSPEAIVHASTQPIFDGLDEKPTTPGEFFAAVYAQSKSLLSESPVARRIDSMQTDDFAREIPIANDGFQSLLEVFDQPFHERYRTVSQLLDRAARNQDSQIYRYTMPTSLQSFDAYRRNRTWLEGFRCLVCLRRWQINHSDAPPNLASVLLDAGVNELPIDPYGHGEPFRLRVIDGEPVICSVGPDGIDDEGLIEWNLHPDSPGDVTFRLETEAERNQRLQKQ